METSPPRPLAPGDVVAAYSEELSEWTAAQVTDLDPAWRTAGVLELDWSGAEPSSVDDLDEPAALRLTHHAHTGRLSHCNYEWLLPRSYKVLGNVPLLHDRRSSSYSSGWSIGGQLAMQRRWDRGERSAHHPGERSFLGAEIADLVARSEPFTDIWSISVTEIDSLDGDDIAALFPKLTRLSLSGNLGTLSGAAGLNRLPSLKTLFITDLFGMSAADCLSSTAVPGLEMLGLHSVPAEYATAMRKTWRAEIPNGTFVEITSPRKPDWVTENRDNPLRDWDGREHISAARYRKSVAQYKATRRAVLAALDDGTDAARLAELGRQFGEAFNQLDGTADPFIETEEREELFGALDAIVDHAQAQHGRTFDAARQHLTAGADGVRNW
ncbi:hypothetical protein [Virgisporangium aurantiacum]|uniref:Uncharacterized protein n=1 Tax=Virgisporangium aurantiacum TaxID=175570 RepID=A0A8J3Z7D4_9ACTN|nr:hypothetical protein [Virgisporangium aurantiacum]GIJ57693.1 hypothetical protein Vau01_052090 [Virgisporangium aurantiacum]